MKVTIVRTEIPKKVKTGFLRSEMVPTYQINANIDFSPEELAIIKKQRLGPTIVYTNMTPGYENDRAMDFNFTIDFIVKNKAIHDRFDTVIEANNFENKLKEDLLPTLKGYIAGNESTGNKSETLEF